MDLSLKSTTIKKNKMRKIILILVTIVLAGALKAQQDPMFTHYMYNTLTVNPAYAGSRDALTATLLHRNQWVDFPGAPKTLSATIHSPVQRGVNLGLSIYNDQIGPVNTTSITASYAYRFKLTEKSKLALGLNAGFNSIHVNFNGFELNQAGDPTFANSPTSFLPNFGVGAYYSTDRFYAGVSVPKLLESAYIVDEQGGTEEAILKRHYFFISGAMINLNEDWDIKPTTLIKVTNGSPIQWDLTAEMVYQEKFDFGVFYRTDLNVTQLLKTGDGFGAIVGMNVNQNMHIGYSYDFSIANPTSYANKGSHEIMLRYDLEFVDKFKIRSPRYF